MPIALVTNYLSGYRLALYERLAERHGVEVLCYGGGRRYVPAWFADLDAQLQRARFPARRLAGWGETLALGRRYDAVIAPFAGGAILPAAYAGARRYGRPFVLWASVWKQPRSAAHLLARPATRQIYRQADAVVAYGEHVRRFVAEIRGRDDDVFVAPQSVEAELFGRPVSPEETGAFRRRFGLGDQRLILYAGRLVSEKGVEVLLEAWRRGPADGVLVLVGDGPLRPAAAATPRTVLTGALPRSELPIAYAAAELTVLPSIPTPRFQEPWGLVCNEAMHQARAVIATDAVGAVAGGLIRHAQTGLVVPAGDPAALAASIDRLLADRPLARRLGQAGRSAVAAYTYDAMVQAFDQALGVALGGPARRSGRARRRPARRSAK